MSKPIWFRFYPLDWITDRAVKRMSDAQVRTYIELLCIQAIEGGLPEEPEEIMIELGINPKKWASVWRAPLDEKFPVDDDGMRRNKKLVKALQIFHSMSEGGRRGGLNKGGQQPPLKPEGGETEAEAEADIEQDEGASGDESPVAPRRVWWNKDLDKLEASDEFKKQLVADFVGEEKLTMSELKDEIGNLSRWLQTRPHRRGKRSRLDRFLYNNLGSKLKDKQATERARPTQRKVPKDSKPAYCKACRERLPQHAKWCKEKP